MSIRISDYFGKNLGEKAIFSFIIGIVGLITISLSSWQAPVSQAQTAEPLISSITGVVADGSSVNIYGSGFGSKTTVAPHIWDGVDNQSLYNSISEGALVPAGNGYLWQYNDTTYSNGIKLTRNRANRGTRTAHYYLDVKGWLTGWDNMDNGNAEKFYATWWMKPTDNIICGPSGACASTKVIRVWSSSDAQRATLSWTGNQIVYEYGDSRGQVVHWKNWQGVSNQWNRLEVYADNLNGIIELYTNGALVDRLEVGQPAYYIDRIWRMGLDPSVPENLDQNLKVDFGEIYVDDTPTRVEICTGSTWSHRGQCEIQIPRSIWNNSQIQVSINQGILTNGQQAYVYVLSGNNTASNGYPVTIAGTTNPPSVPLADTQAPSVPGNVSAVVCGTQINLYLTASTDNVGVSQYLVERSTSASSGFVQIATANSNSYIDTGLNTGTTYYYRVRAQDVAGNNSNYSSIASVTIPASVTNPPVVGNLDGQSWERVYYKDFENSQILEAGKFTVHLGLPIASGYQIINESSNKVLQGNLGSSGDKRSQVLMLNLENMGIDAHGEFYLKTKVKIRPNNLWCVLSDYGAMPTSICPNGRDGTKLAYAFGDNGVAWIPGMGFPPAESGFGQWKFTDNRGNGTGSGYQRYFDNASNVTVDDGQWHEWIWHFKHNTQTNGVWNNDGVYEFYIDNKLAARATDVPYTIIRDGITRDGSFNRISKPISYFGGGGTLANDWIYWVDNIEVYKPSTSNTQPPSTFSSWCSALHGIVSSAVSAGSTNRVADLNHDSLVNLGDLTLMTSWYNQKNESACQTQFNNTYDSNNYLTIDWCSGVFKGLQDSLGASQGSANYSSTFDLNNDGSINLTDTVLISQYKSTNNQSACFTEYNLPLSTANNQVIVKNVVLVSKVVQDSQKVRQKDVQTIAAKVKKQTAAQTVRTLKNRLAYDSVAGSLFYTNVKGKVIIFDNSSLVKQLAKQALGISTNSLSQIATGFTPGVDADGDGIADTTEAAIGTDINKIDTDGDGIADGIEIANKYSPLKSSRTKLSDSLAKRLGIGRILIDSKKGNIWIIGADYKKYLIESGTTIDTLRELYLVVTVDGVKLK